MAKPKYRQIKRDGRWITVDQNGKEVKVGQGQLGDLLREGKKRASQFGQNLVYSDKTDDKGRPLTVAQANAGTDANSNKPKRGDTKKDEKGRTLIYNGKTWVLKSSLDNKDSAINRYRTPSGRPQGTTRNWTNGHGAQSDKPSEGDRSTWSNKKDKETTTTQSSSGGSSGGGNRNGSSGGSSGSNNTTSTPPRRRTPAVTGQGPVRDGRKYGRLLRSEKTARENERVRGETKEELKKQGMSDRMAKALSGIKKWEDPKKKK